MSERPDPLDAAAELARAAPDEPGDWEQTAGSVMRRVRATLRPGRPVPVPLSDERGSATYVDERVVVAALRRCLVPVDGVDTSAIRLLLDGGTCTGLDVEVVARYGLDLPALGETCRTGLHVVLRDLLLDGADAIDVRVTVVDVSLEDPER